MAVEVARDVGEGRVQVIAWLVVPPPFQWDASLLQSLRSLTSHATGVILDILGIIHLQSGNTFAVPGKDFFIEDACSGIQSLMALLCVSALWSVIGRLPLLVAICSFVCAGWIAVLLNITRVLTIVLAQSFWQVDLSAGWRHESLGLALFGISLFLIGSTNQLWLFWFSPVPKSAKRLSPANKQKASKSPLVGPSFVGRWPTILVGSALLLWVPQLGHLSRHLVKNQQAEMSLRVIPTAQAMAESDLPPEMNGWRRTNFRPLVRDRHNLEGEFSRQWTYQAPFGVVHFSLDFPFAGPHALTKCYQFAGWKFTVLRTVPTEWPRDTGGFQEVELKRREFEEGYLLYSPWGCNGELIAQPVSEDPTATPKPFLVRLWNRIAPQVTPELAPAVTTFQFQAFAVSEVPLSPSDREAVHRQFLECREILQNKFKSDELTVSPATGNSTVR